MLGAGSSVRTPSTFNDTKPPPGYIPGVGRGAVGFMTRSDLGSAGVLPEAGTGVSGRGAGRGVAAASGIAAIKKLSQGGSVPGAAAGDKDKRETDYSESNYDKFSGYSERLFGDAPYEDDDREADRVYAEIDERMESRTTKRKEAANAAAAAAERLTQTRIADNFVDLKPALAQLRVEEWDAIPDIGDRSLKLKKKALDQQYTPVPDNIIELGRADRAGGAAAAASALSTAAAADASAGVTTDVLGLQRGRTQMLSMKLDRMGDSVSGQTTVDPKGYLTSLSASAPLSDASDLEDIKKARLLMKSVVTTNPKHGPGWVALARLEEQVRNLPEARRLIRQGCEMCPTDEDVWLEAARIQTPAHARIVLADAVKHLPGAVKLWMRAAELEGEPDAKRAVLRKALTLIPASERLWKAAISLEGPDDARIMLSRAVECVPSSVDLWLALARLETYEAAQRVLNQARAALPSEPAVWLAAAKLEEAQGHDDMVGRIVARAIKSLTAQQAQVDREAWLKAADEAERAGAPLTCAAIVRATADVGVEAMDRLRTWGGDASAMEARGSIAAARAMYACALEAFPGEEATWMAAAGLEKRHGAPGALDALYRRAVRSVPASETLWLMAAKAAWLGGRIDDARHVLRDAFAANPASEAVLLAAVKLEWENEEVGRARALLEKARAAAPSPRVWLKSAALEREVGDAPAEERLLLDGVGRFPSAPKLWLMLAQLYERGSAVVSGAPGVERARETLALARRACSGSVPVWTASAALEERLSGAAKARSLLEAARSALPACPDLWVAAIRLERRHANEKVADVLMAKALQECPASGLLWAEDILSAPRPAQKRKSVDALKRCDNDAVVVTAVAKLFWGDRKYEKARKWFDRAVTLDRDYGDAWAAWAAFEQLHGDAESVAALERRCSEAEPAHGELWQSISKRVENRRCTRVQVLRMAVGELRSRAERAGAGSLERLTLGAAAVAAVAGPSPAAVAAVGGAAAAAMREALAPAVEAVGAATGSGRPGGGASGGYSGTSGGVFFANGGGAPAPPAGLAGKKRKAEGDLALE